MSPKLIVEQKITAFTNKYLISTANSDGSRGELMAFAEQKRLAFKEKVSFYTDESKKNVAFTFRAEKVMDVHGRYIVEDTEGQFVGSFKKEFTKSFIRSTWNILGDKDTARLQVTESNTALALLRRYGGLVPILGAFSEIVTSLLKYHFNVINLANGNVVGIYKKTKLFRDHYLLSIDDETYGQIDWRVLASVSVALDALQSR